MPTSFPCFSELVWKPNFSIFNWCFWVIFSLWLQSLCGERACSGKLLTQLELSISRGQPCLSNVLSPASCSYHPADTVEEVKSSMLTFLYLNGCFWCLWGFQQNSVLVRKTNAAVEMRSCAGFLLQKTSQNTE